MILIDELAFSYTVTFCSVRVHNVSLQLYFKLQVKMAKTWSTVPPRYRCEAEVAEGNFPFRQVGALPLELELTASTEN